MDPQEIQDPMANLVLLEHPVLMDSLDLKDHLVTLELQGLLDPTDNLVLLETMAHVELGNQDCQGNLEHQVLQETLGVMDSQDRMVLLDHKVLLDSLVLLELQVVMVVQERQEALVYRDTMRHIAHVHLDLPSSFHDSRTKLLPHLTVYLR